jgi:predicted TIM-barrel fold metal-dependent hydrolase
MFDHHIHIGQFEEMYYDPLEILQIVVDSGVSGCIYSSTTSGKDGVKYNEIRKEIELTLSRFPHETFKPYLWYVPSYKNEGITIEKAMNDLPYQGIKIHPVANDWDRTVPGNDRILHDLFEYADEYRIPILIHTGPNGVDAPNTFEDFFVKYSKVKYVIAHCRPIEDAIKILIKYDNVFGDTSFVPEEWMIKLVQSGLKDKIYTGSDFPITHYWETHLSGNSDTSLINQYCDDIMQMAYWEKI